MKRIILTESQYKRLVRQPLNESGRGDIIFENTEDEKDVDADITWLLVYLRNQLYELHQKNVFVKRIEGGKVYLDATKYTDKEVETINYLFSKFSEWKQGYKDQIVGLPKDLTFDIGHDTDYVFNVDTDDDDVVDTEDEQKNYDFTSEIPSRLHSVMYMISKVESNHNYNIQSGEKSPSVILTDKTIRQVAEDYGTNAKGRWQHMPKYIKKRATSMGLNLDDKFSKVNQDKMAMGLIIGWNSWDCSQLAQKIAQIWAAAPVLYDQKGDKNDIKRGQSYYDGVGSNKALIDVDDFEAAVRESGCGVSSNDYTTNVETSDSEISGGGGSIDLRNKIVTKSESRLGEPYEIGDEFDEVGGDCSGLIDWVLRNTDGINSPYNGRETSKALQKLVKPSNKKKKNGLYKGDILVFNKMKGEKYGHVGFVHKVTDGKVDMIHSSGSKGVNITKDIFNNSFWSGSRYYGAIPIVDGKYESN